LGNLVEVGLFGAVSLLGVLNCIQQVKITAAESSLGICLSEVVSPALNTEDRLAKPQLNVYKKKLEYNNFFRSFLIALVA